MVGSYEVVYWPCKFGLAWAADMNLADAKVSVAAESAIVVALSESRSRAVTAWGLTEFLQVRNVLDKLVKKKSDLYYPGSTSSGITL